VWYGIGTDIEDRKRAEEELRAAEHEARELLERVPAMISLRTAAGIAYTNQRIHNYIGVGQEELPGAGWQKYIHPEDRERALANQTRSTEEIEPWIILYRSWSGWNLSLVQTSRNHIKRRGESYCWYGVATDIE
jgi:PAS domain S-box-containing protein